MNSVEASTATSALRDLPKMLARALEEYADRLDLPGIRDAYQFAVEAHSGQKRASGDAFVSHAVDVATILAEFQMDTATIIVGLVHDTVEDTSVSVAELHERFGDQVAKMVDGVTKIGRVEFRSHTERQVENYRKLLLSMAVDARVILVKLADRLHNMRTIEHLAPGKQKRIALETREIYAPLAHRLGMAEVKWEMEDLAFRVLEPEAYRELRRKVHQRRKERERQIQELKKPLEEALAAAGIPCTVTGRPKHLWSIYRKMTVRGMPYEEIFDLMAMRVVTDSIQNCYAALGVVHSRWTPVQERFRDYVATPKSNMYRSVHTTIFGPGGRRYEVQIRTEAMHRTAEHGIAAHWHYKEGSEDAKRDEVDETLAWFRQVLEWQKETEEPEEFMEFLKMDLFQGEIFVFTPKGDVKQLPVGATPIDFAFAVHTEVGMHCAGARVDGRIAPLSRELRNGDTIEILTNPKQWPNRDWLAFVKTVRARGRIRHWIRKEEFAAAMRIGQDFLDQELKRARKARPTAATLNELAEGLGHTDSERLMEALGRGDIAVAAVMRALYPGATMTDIDPPTRPLARLTERLRKGPRGVRIQGMDNLMVQFSVCCQPVPGDDVLGYITRGRGVSIHRSDCPNILTLSAAPERRVEIEWTAEKGDRFFVKVYLTGTDRHGLLTDVSKAITDTSTNIRHADMRSTDMGMVGAFVVEVQHLSHLEKVLKAVKRVKGVISVARRESFGEADLPDS